jgi:hypothetical protein
MHSDRVPVSCNDEICWKRLIESHIKRYPELQIEDLYKLLYQSTLGNGHAVTDSSEAADWLSRDLLDMARVLMNL